MIDRISWSYDRNVWSVSVAANKAVYRRKDALSPLGLGARHERKQSLCQATSPQAREGERHHPDQTSALPFHVAQDPAPFRHLSLLEAIDAC